MRAAKTKSPRKQSTVTLSARLHERVTLQAQPDGKLVALVESYPIDLGRFSAQTLQRAEDLREGLPLAALAGSKPLAQEIATLVRRLARRGLVEYALTRGSRDLVIIEPQLPDYWPQPAKLRAADSIVLSRFACLRRRADALVLESPRSPALFRICDPAIAGFLAGLAVPGRIAELKQQRAFPGLELLGLLAHSEMLFTTDATSDSLRDAEGDAGLVLWDFHDLLFHVRSTEGRQANPLGGLYPYAGRLPPLPAERPAWPGRTVALSAFAHEDAPDLPIATLLRERHSVREFDTAHPITLAELARFLNLTARVLARWEDPVDPEDANSPHVSYASRPYPGAGSAYELELYLAIGSCAGLPRGFYHYDASAHALNAIEVAEVQLEAMLDGAQFAIGAETEPQLVITIAARFGRLSWKYAGIAYSLVLKDVGVLLQTLYLAATDMGLGGCAVGTSNIELFAKMTGLPFHVEGPVGVFALGRPAASERPG